MITIYPPEEGAVWPYSGYTVATGGGWLPGIYISEEAARLAPVFKYRALELLSTRVCAFDRRHITIEDLEGLRP
jgi:hypothetical protein